MFQVFFFLCFNYLVGLAKFLFSVRHVVVCVVSSKTQLAEGVSFWCQLLLDQGLCDGGSVYHYFLGGHGI